MACDFDKQQWQADQAARDAAIEKQREKERKTRERSARNAKRKLERLHRTLSEKGDISDFESEFAQSVSERLDEFGSAFNDLEKGRPGDALSFAQKRVVASMNRKAKDLRKQPSSEDGASDDLQHPRFEARKPRSSFKSKAPKYTPRVRQIDETFDVEPDASRSDPDRAQRLPDPERPPVQTPFLRLVQNDD